MQKAAIKQKDNEWKSRPKEEKAKNQIEQFIQVTKSFNAITEQSSTSAVDKDFLICRSYHTESRTLVQLLEYEG